MENERLLRALVGLVGRQTFPPERLAEIIGSGEKQQAAFNMCDGSKGQGEIAKAAGINDGNFSRTVARWIAEGIVIRLGDGRDAKLLHLYPLLETPKKK
jgi:hypothetical protein